MGTNVVVVTRIHCRSKALIEPNVNANYSKILLLQPLEIKTTPLLINPCPAEPGYTLPLQTL